MDRKYGSLASGVMSLRTAQSVNTHPCRWHPRPGAGGLALAITGAASSALALIRHPRQTGGARGFVHLPALFSHLSITVPLHASAPHRGRVVLRPGAFASSRWQCGAAERASGGYEKASSRTLRGIPPPSGRRSKVPQELGRLLPDNVVLALHRRSGYAGTRQSVRACRRNAAHVVRI